MMGQASSWSLVAARAVADALQRTLLHVAPVTFVLCWCSAALAAATSLAVERVTGLDLLFCRQAAGAGALVFSVLLGPATVATYLLLGRLVWSQGLLGHAARKVMRLEKSRASGKVACLSLLDPSGGAPRTPCASPSTAA